MDVIFKHSEGRVSVSELPNGKRRVSVSVPKESTYFSRRRVCDTSYPLELIESILRIKGPTWLCDEIMRDEDSSYVQRHLRFSILGYMSETSFKNHKILDFGCGPGASTMVLARMFPKSHILGIDLDHELLAIAKLRATYYGFSHVKFLQSPSGCQLPKGIGLFEFVIMSAVYEHLLPDERKVLMPMLWSIIKPGGILFVNQTPHRYFPVEKHTTGLPLINYLPDRMVFTLATKFCSRVRAIESSWQTLLRRGIRGATEAEIISKLDGQCQRPILLQPSRLGLRDRIDLWAAIYSLKLSPIAMRMMLLILRFIKSCFGITLTHYLSLAIKKDCSPQQPGSLDCSNDE